MDALWEDTQDGGEDAGDAIWRYWGACDCGNGAVQYNAYLPAVQTNEKMVGELRRKLDAIRPKEINLGWNTKNIVTLINNVNSL